MNTAETISVNPVSKTLGSLNPEATLKFLKENAQRSKAFENKKTLSLTNLLLSSSTPRVNVLSGRLLLFRVLFAALLIVSGSLILSDAIISPINFIDTRSLALLEIIVGGMLAIGFMSRPAMAVASVLFAYSSIVQIIAGVFDMQCLLCFLGSFIFMVMGSGRYSIDFLIRKAIVVRKHRKEKKLRENRLSYRAFRIHNMDY